MQSLGPVLADAFDQPPQQGADFLARWRLAGAQNHGHRASGRGVIDVDRQKAALVVMGVPFRHFLAAMHNIERVVEIQEN